MYTQLHCVCSLAYTGHITCNSFCQLEQSWSAHCQSGSARVIYYSLDTQQWRTWWGCMSINCSHVLCHKHYSFVIHGTLVLNPIQSPQRIDWILGNNENGILSLWEITTPKQNILIQRLFTNAGAKYVANCICFFTFKNVCANCHGASYKTHISWSM